MVEQEKENIKGRAAYETLKSSMGIDKVLQGSTTIAEVLRSTVEDF